MTSNKLPLKNSLAAKKKGAAPKLKNIMVQPFPRYWPEINGICCEQLKEHISDAYENNDKKSYHEIGISIGTATCLRLLKRREVSCLLLSTEIKPKFIITQIIYSTISKNDGVAVLCVPNLKQITEEIFKIPTLILAVIKNKQSRIENWIQEVSGKFPIPEKILKYYCLPDGGTNNSIISKNIENSCDTKHTKLFDRTEVDFNKLYLTRCTPSQRAFLPDNAKDLKPLTDEKNDWPDYISFSEKKSSVIKMEVEDSNPQSSTKIEGQRDNKLPDKNLDNKQKFNKTKKKKILDSSSNNQNVFSYISLNVNKIQGNPDKVKKKKNKKKKQ